MSHARSILLAGLLVLSTIVTGVGPALAQSTETATDSGPVTKTFETGPHKVKIDLFDVSSETTITVITDESPAGDNTAILKKTVSGSQNSAHFRNAGAYESFTVKVEGADGPVAFSKGGPTAAWTPGDDGKFLGDTGGDPGFTYDLSEQIGESVMPQIVQLDRTGLPESETINMTGLDANQIKLDIYQDAQDEKAKSDNYHAVVNNRLQDAKTVARVKGKNAYIRALNNGSSKSAAKTAAKQAVEEHYATVQVNLANRYSAAVYQADYWENTLSSESGVSPSYVQDYRLSDDTDTSILDEFRIKDHGGSTASVTLVNQSTTTVPTVTVETVENKLPGTDTQTQQGLTQTPSATVNGYTATFEASKVKTHDGTAPAVVSISYQEYANSWSTIQSQSQTVKSEMDTLVENTYSAYQQGDINSSDLVDPYVLANQQSAGDDFQGWTAAQLTLMGTNSPENFDQIGSFNITTGSGTQYEGVLFSQENPASGQFENGTTYNPSQIGGTQYVVTSDRIVELQSNFTVDKITTTNGQTVQNVTIQKTTYETTNVTELKQQYEDLAQKRAEIEAREQNLRGSAGGGLLGGSSSSLVLVLVGIGALYAVGQRRTGGNN